MLGLLLRKDLLQESKHKQGKKGGTVYIEKGGMYIMRNAAVNR